MQRGLITFWKIDILFFFDYYEVILQKSRGYGMYIHRTLEKYINELSKQFKVLLVVGARQVGKSTILKHCGNDLRYVTFDDYRTREMAANEP